LEEGQQVLTLNDFAALSQSKTIIEKIKKLETEIVEYNQQAQLIDSISFHILSQTLPKMISDLGTVGEPRQSLCFCKHIVLKSTFFYRRTII
jgi:hypothetical protein